MTRSVAQMDQITMHIKHSAEHADDPHLLKSMKRDGMFTDPAFVAVSIVAADGVVRSSTQPAMVGEALSARAFHHEHRNSNSSAMRIGAAPRRDNWVWAKTSSCSAAASTAPAKISRAWC